MNKMLVARNLSKGYALAKGVYPVFQDLDIEIDKGEFVGIMGVSGVGKTTLLNLLGGLDRPTAGRVYVEDEDIFSLDDRRLARFRNTKVGFVFQFFHLLPEFSALENVCLPLLIRGVSRREADSKARRVLGEVQLAGKEGMRPAQLSGGEQQRVAIARALANDPSLLLADEPTGNVDWSTGEHIIRLFLDIHRQRSLTSVVVTHNEKVAQYCHKLYLMESGRLKPLSLP